MPGGFSYRFVRAGTHLRAMGRSSESYETWSREQLIARLKELESHGRPSTASTSHRRPSPTRQQKPFNFAAHPRRKIALKFSYNGSEYGGLEYQKTPTRLPTVEGVLFDALVHTRLVDPSGGFEGCGWEKCGRTDKGVSAAGQVVSFWVRSALPQNVGAARDVPLDQSSAGTSTDGKEALTTEDDSQEMDGESDLMGDWDEAPSNAARPPAKPPTELPYVSSLNQVLPPTIRVIAWSPVSDKFSARFSCKFRHYKYFFNAHGLDIAAMKDAAHRLVGEHDFRNLCKLDAGKQLTSFTRKILSVDISPAESAAVEGIYVFNLKGTAFLYNQVRHIMAVLFLVGTGLEHPSVVSALLNADPQNLVQPLPGEGPYEVVSCKPEYQMADPLPLMLWECGFDESDVRWRTDGIEEEEPRSGSDAVFTQRALSSNLYHLSQALYERSTIRSVMDAYYLKAAAQFHAPPPSYFPVGHPDSVPIPKGAVVSAPLGAGTYRRGANYVPLLRRPRLDPVEVANERWRVGKGARRLERKATEAADNGDE